MVEVLIAVLLLTVVVSGVGLALSSGLRTQTAFSTVKSLNGVAQRVFEHVRSDRDWVEGCTMSRRSCPLSVPRSVLEDSSLGDSCSGGTYAHSLTRAQAQPIDSAVDGTGPQDADRRLPDHFRIHIEVAAEPCARARLGNPRPAVFISALDPSGEVLEGSLEVEVCVAENQVDDRMSVGGCAPGGGDAFKMFQCPPASPIYNGTPARNCVPTWNTVASRAAHRTDPSPYVVLARSSARFRIVDGTGRTVATSGRAARPAPGLYRFDDLPSGVYFVRDMAPTGANASRLTVWDTKLIPGERGIVVQPEVRSRALITFRPRDVGDLRFAFRRDVTRHRAYKVVTGWQNVTTRNPTQTWEGPPETLRAQYESSAQTAQAMEAVLRIVCFLACDASDVQVYARLQRGVPTPNCVTLSIAYRILDSSGYLMEPTTSCTFYDMDVRFTYWTTERLADQRRNGAVLGQSLATSPMPTFRYVVPPRTLSANGCPSVFSSGRRPLYGGRMTFETFGCVPTRDPRNYILQLRPFAAGLNAGLTSESDVYTPRWGTQFFNDGGGGWTVSRNETVQPIPAGLKRAIWVRTDGTIVDASGTTYRPGTTINVVGRGECYWVYGGSERQGHCNPCRPFIQPLNGSFPSCFVLVRVDWKKHFYCEGFISCSARRSSSQPTLQACSGAPRPGNVDNTAPNCSPTFADPVNESGCDPCGTPTEIPSVEVPLGGGNGSSYSTAIGG